jgi:hypothetical protein
LRKIRANRAYDSLEDSIREMSDMWARQASVDSAIVCRHASGVKREVPPSSRGENCAQWMICREMPFRAVRELTSKNARVPGRTCDQRETGNRLQVKDLCLTDFSEATISCDVEFVLSPCRISSVTACYLENSELVASSIPVPVRSNLMGMGAPHSF